MSKKIYNFYKLIIEEDRFSLSSWLRYCGERKAFVYVVRIFDDVEDFIKVGRTCRRIEDRFSTLPYRWRLVYADYISPTTAFKKEAELHSLLKKYSYFPLNNFSGMTECYTLEAVFYLSELLNFQNI